MDQQEEHALSYVVYDEKRVLMHAVLNEFCEIRAEMCGKHGPCDRIAPKQKSGVSSIVRYTTTIITFISAFVILCSIKTCRKLYLDGDENICGCDGQMRSRETRVILHLASLSSHRFAISRQPWWMRL